MALTARAGEICGTIVFDGKAPTMAAVQVDADPKCSILHDEPLLQDWLVLGEGQTVANVLIEVVKGLPVQEYPVPEKEMVLTQKGCMYDPHVLAIRAGQTLRVLNPDLTAHNIHFLPSVNHEFNKSMPETRKEMTHVFDEAEDVFTIRCDVHSWMLAYCVVFDHPYFAVTGMDGKFSIGNLPAGEYTLRVWHEKLGEREETVTIPDEGVLALDIKLKRPGR